MDERYNHAKGGLILFLQRLLVHRRHLQQHVF
jgi:hypothetical protein